MSCKDREQNVALYLYDEMPAAERAAFDRHLEGCPACRGALEEWRRLQTVLNERAAPELTPELLVRSRQALEEALEREHWGWRALVREWFPRGFPEFSRVAAVVTLVAFGFSLGWLLRPRVSQMAAPGAASTIPASMTGSELGGARINSISQVAPDPQTGQVRITLNAERRVTMEGSLDDPHIRQVLVYAVKSYGNPGIRLDTLSALREGAQDPSVQEALLYALGNDKNAGVRLEALKAVRRMEWSPEVEKALVNSVERDSNSGLRGEAIDELVERAVKNKDRDLVPVFTRLAVDEPDRYVRLKAVAALRELGQEPF
jgi:Putative zinc-finger